MDDVGLGLFLGLSFCGLIYLFVQTKDRWNWAQARKIILIGIGTLVLLAALSIAGLTSYEYYQHLPIVITEFQGLKLGDTLSDACFKLGPPVHPSPTKTSAQEE